MITLREITAANWHAIVALRVAGNQEPWVASNGHSLIEAAYGFEGELAHLKLVPLAIYAEETPVGFALYNMPPERDRFFIMRLMIDSQHQGKGYGRAAIELLLNLMRANPQAKEVAISYNTGNTAAQRLYQACGFVEIGPDGGEGVLMWQALNPQPSEWTSIWRPSTAE